MKIEFTTDYQDYKRGEVVDAKFDMGGRPIVLPRDTTDTSLEFPVQVGAWKIPICEQPAILVANAPQKVAETVAESLRRIHFHDTTFVAVEGSRVDRYDVRAGGPYARGAYKSNLRKVARALADIATIEHGRIGAMAT